MNEGTIALTVMTGLLLISFLGFLIWGIRSGQFKNIEEAKYQVLRDKKNEKPPGNSPPQNPGAGGGEKP
jgi:cbb3-type cytochrome oxidase maturation protein